MKKIFPPSANVIEFPYQNPTEATKSLTVTVSTMPELTAELEEMAGFDVEDRRWMKMIPYFRSPYEMT